MPAAGVSASATSASGQRVLSGSCTGNTNSSSNGRVEAYYTPNGSYDVVDKITYKVWATKGTKPGKKNNVSLRIRESISVKPDTTHSHHPYRQVAYKTRWHIDAKFVFDYNGVDPRCTATTNKA
jgi:hypothetical protein